MSSFFFSLAAVVTSVSKDVQADFAWAAYLAPMLAFGANSVHKSVIKHLEGKGSADAYAEVSKVCEGLVLDILHSVRENLAFGGTDHDLKVTLFVKRGNRLEVLYRSGGTDESTCEHTFSLSGQNNGVAGKAFETSNAITAYSLPDLHAELSKPELNSAIDVYAKGSYVLNKEVREERKKKISNGRRMPRALYGLRIWGDNREKLGVIVIDTSNVSFTTEQEEMVGKVISVLKHPLPKLL